MKYFPSPYINALSRHDARLEPYCGEITNTLLIEEKSIQILLSEKYPSMNLIVLVESETSVLSCVPHKIIKRVFKYRTITQLLVEIFDERYEVRLFISPRSRMERMKYLLEQDVINAPFITILDEYRHSKSLCSEKYYLERGVHYFYSSLLDVIDPPSSFITKAVVEQSGEDPVDIVLYSINGCLAKELIEISDIVYIIVTEDEKKHFEPLIKRYPHFIFLIASDDNDIVQLDNIIPRKGDEYEL